MTKTITMLVGLPGSGKSTYLQKLKDEGRNFVTLSTDDYLEDKAKELGKTYNEMHRDYFDAAESALYHDLEGALSKGSNIVWDQTNLSVKSRGRKLKNIPASYRKVAVVFFPPAENEHRRRLASRKGKEIPWRIIEDMQKSFEIPDESEGFDEVIMVYGKKQTDEGWD